MRNFQDTFETRKRWLISAFTICMAVPLKTRAAMNAKISVFVIYVEAIIYFFIIF